MLALVSTAVVGPGSPFGAQEASSGSTIHVDCTSTSSEGASGSITNPIRTLVDATAASERLLPGDTLAFKRGTFCAGDGLTPSSGTLYIRASGSLERPITIGSYGDPAAAAPIINAMGDPTALVIDDQSHLIVEDLALRNSASPNAIVAALRVRAINADISGLTLHGLDIRDINCVTGNTRTSCNDNASVDPVDSSPETGGSGTLAAVSIQALGAEPRRISDTRITNSVFANVPYGIKTWTKWSARESPSPLPITGVEIRDNRFENIQLGAAMIGGTKNAVFADNIVDGFARNSTKTSAGVFPYYSESIRISGNEFTGGGGGDQSTCLMAEETPGTEQRCQSDGQAIDIDESSQNVLVEHNWSHDNDRGFLMFCGTDKTLPGGTLRPIDQITVRYNLSSNDRGYGARFACSGKTTNVTIYNNTFVVGDGIAQAVFANVKTDEPNHPYNYQPGLWANSVEFTNNAIVALKGSTVTTHLSTTGVGAPRTYRGASNVYRGPITENGTWSILPNPVDNLGIALQGDLTGDWSTRAALQLAPTADLFNNGKPFDAAGTPATPPIADAFGRPVDRLHPNIGADDSPTPPRSTSPNSTEPVHTPTPVYTGTGDPGATISVAGASGRLLSETVTVDPDGQWVAPTRTGGELIPMAYSVIATQTSGTDRQQTTINFTYTAQ